VTTLYSLKDMAVQEMDYNPRDYPGGYRLADRPLRARAAFLADPFKDLGDRQSRHVNTLVGTQIDTHPEWFGGNENFDDREFIGRLGWKKWFNSTYNNSPVEEYPGEVDLIDMGDYWQGKTRSKDIGINNGMAVAVEVWSTAKLKEAGTYRITGQFTDIDWHASGDSGQHQEEFAVYAIQSETGYMAGTTRNSFAWVYNGGASNEVLWSDPNAIHEMDWPRRTPTLALDYTFSMDIDLPYVTFLVRQMTKNATSGGKSAVTTANWKNFRVERVS
jgi:hypothetical protein